MSTTIMISCEVDASFVPDECGMGDGCTAEEVVRAMMESGRIETAVADWDLLPGNITVTCVQDDGKRSHSSWEDVERADRRADARAEREPAG